MLKRSIWFILLLLAHALPTTGSIGWGTQNVSRATSQRQQNDTTDDCCSKQSSNKFLQTPSSTAPSSWNITHAIAAASKTAHNSLAMCREITTHGIAETLGLSKIIEQAAEQPATVTALQITAGASACMAPFIMYYLSECQQLKLRIMALIALRGRPDLIKTVFDNVYCNKCKIEAQKSAKDPKLENMQHAQVVGPLIRSAAQYAMPHLVYAFSQFYSDPSQDKKNQIDADIQEKLQAGHKSTPAGQQADHYARAEKDLPVTLLRFNKLLNQHPWLATGRFYIALGGYGYGGDPNAQLITIIDEFLQGYTYVVPSSPLRDPYLFPFDNPQEQQRQLDADRASAKAYEKHLYQEKIGLAKVNHAIKNQIKIVNKIIKHNIPSYEDCIPQLKFKIARMQNGQAIRMADGSYLDDAGKECKLNPKTGRLDVTSLNGSVSSFEKSTQPNNTEAPQEAPTHVEPDYQEQMQASTTNSMQGITPEEAGLQHTGGCGSTTPIETATNTAHDPIEQLPDSNPGCGSTTPTPGQTNTAHDPVEELPEIPQGCGQLPGLSAAEQITQLFLTVEKSPPQKGDLSRIDVRYKKDTTHIFRDEEGHLPYTDESHAIILDLVKDFQNYAGEDKARNHWWYSKILPDGTQLWATVRGEVIQNGGLNKEPKVFDPYSGFSASAKP